MSLPGSYQLTRPPRDDDELYQLVKALWGVIIPRNKVCAHHQAPFDAFATAFFAREPQVLVRGSRGLSGKSQMMSILGITQAVVLGADNNIVGGSEQQSKNVLEHMKRAWEAPGSPRFMIPRNGDRTQEMILTNGAKIRPLTASQRSVRGPHPARLLLDEIDEMDAEIMESAKGQPMPQPNWMGVVIPQQTIMVSTLQYADGSMMKEMQRFEEEGLPIYEWCVASGSLITTARGQVPIQEVTNDDLVLTRNGWRHVQHVTFMGNKPTLRLDVGNQSLYVTPDHKIATDGAWVRADALAADAMSSTWSDVRVLGSELVPLTAVRGTVLVPPSSGLVLGVGDKIEVFDVDTGSVTTEVIDSESFWDGAYYVLPHPTMGLDDSVLDSLTAIPVTPESRPLDAVSGEHGHIVLPVWDIGVEGDDHEFVANGVLVHNCYQDTANSIDGWLSPDFIEQKKREVSKERWRVEYELGEPSIGNRAFDSAAVERTFDLKVKEEQIVKQSKEFEEYKFEEPRNDRWYVIAADWAKAVDWTVITVWDVTYEPMRLVYYVRLKRRPYPVMVGYFNELKKRYEAEAIHDATGLGGVVADLVEGSNVYNFLMTGSKRDNMLSEYVTAVENDKVRSHRVPSMYRSTLYCSTEDLFSRGKEYHLPDEVCSAALAWHVAKDRVQPIAPVGMPKVDHNWMESAVTYNRSTTEEHWAKGGKRIEGEVEVLTEEFDVGLDFTH